MIPPFGIPSNPMRGAVSKTSELLADLQVAYDKVKEWPEKRMPGVDITTLGEGFIDLLILRNLIPDVITALAPAEQTSDEDLLDQAVAFSEMWGTAENWQQLRDAFFAAVKRDRQSRADEAYRDGWQDHADATPAPEPQPEVAAEPVAWMHPEAGWAHERFEQIAMHCRKDGPGPIPLYATPPVVEEAVKVENPRPLVDELTGALRFIMAFYEPGQNYLDTNAWKVAEAGGRSALAKGEAFLTEQAAAAEADAIRARRATP